MTDDPGKIAIRLREIAILNMTRTTAPTEWSTTLGEAADQLETLDLIQRFAAKPKRGIIISYNRLATPPHWMATCGMYRSHAEQLIDALNDVESHFEKP